MGSRNKSRSLPPGAISLTQFNREFAAAWQIVDFDYRKYMGPVAEPRVDRMMPGFGNPLEAHVAETRLRVLWSRAFRTEEADDCHYVDPRAAIDEGAFQSLLNEYKSDPFLRITAVLWKLRVQATLGDDDALLELLNFNADFLYTRIVLTKALEWRVAYLTRSNAREEREKVRRYLDKFCNIIKGTKRVGAPASVDDVSLYLQYEVLLQHYQTLARKSKLPPHERALNKLLRQIKKWCKDQYEREARIETLRVQVRRGRGRIRRLEQYGLPRT